MARERTVRGWFEKFRSGDVNLKNKPRGKPVSTVDNNELKAIVEGDAFQTARELAPVFKISISTCDGK